MTGGLRPSKASTRLGALENISHSGTYRVPLPRLCCLSLLMCSTPLVLLVEDSDDDAFFFRTTLRKCGASCELVHRDNGGTALDYFTGVETGATRRPDLVFLDPTLPTLSGFEILTWLHERPLAEALRLFVLSGSEHNGDFARAEALGTAGYFVKPISAEDLRATLEELKPDRTADSLPG